MISVRNVSKTFGSSAAVADVSFEVEEGQTLILLGTSGCGKTTTLKMLNRLIEPSAGAIFVNGADIAVQQPEQLRRSMGYVLQRNSLFPHYTVAENIAVVPQLQQWEKHKTDRRMAELAEKLRLPSAYLHKYPHQLSGGEAQRVNLARALVANPPILLMDEPFSALDTIIRAAIRKEFYALDELKKKTIVMVTHDVQEAFEMGDKICLMDKGRIMQAGTPGQLLFNPANDFVRGFLSDAFLQLTFTITTLLAVWPYLQHEENVNGSDINVDTDSSIWKAVEKIRDKNDSSILLTIQHTETREQKLASWSGLLQAFSSYQKNK